MNKLFLLLISGVLLIAENVHKAGTEDNSYPASSFLGLVCPHGSEKEHIYVHGFEKDGMFYKGVKKDKSECKMVFVI